jgi:hypothetical protein
MRMGQDMLGVMGSMGNIKWNTIDVSVELVEICQIILSGCC